MLEHTWYNQLASLQGVLHRVCGRFQAQKTLKCAKKKVGNKWTQNNIDINSNMNILISKHSKHFGGSILFGYWLIMDIQFLCSPICLCIYVDLVNNLQHGPFMPI